MYAHTSIVGVSSGGLDLGCPAQSFRLSGRSPATAQTYGFVPIFLALKYLEINATAYLDFNIE